MAGILAIVRIFQQALKEHAETVSANQALRKKLFFLSRTCGSGDLY